MSIAHDVKCTQIANLSCRSLLCRCTSALPTPSRSSPTGDPGSLDHLYENMPHTSYIVHHTFKKLSKLYHYSELLGLRDYTYLNMSLEESLKHFFFVMTTTSCSRRSCLRIDSRAIWRYVRSHCFLSWSWLLGVAIHQVNQEKLMVLSEVLHCSYHPSSLTYIATQVIFEASYIVTMLGRVTYKIVTEYDANTPQILRENGLIFLIDTETIVRGDIFDLYLIDDDKDKETITQALALPRIDSVYVYCKLHSRTYDLRTTRYVDITRLPSQCPICGSDLRRYRGQLSIISNQAICVNPDCPIHNYRDINRYVSIACNMPSYGSLIMRAVREKLFHAPSDLYLNEVRDHCYQVYSRNPMVMNFFDGIYRSIGNVYLVDYLQSLPIGNVTLTESAIPPGMSGKFLLNTVGVTKDFQHTPIKFMDFLEDNLAYFVISDDYVLWKHKTSSLIENYMSTSLFFAYSEVFELEYSEIFEIEDGVALAYSDIQVPYSKVLESLVDLGVFCKE